MIPAAEWLLQVNAAKVELDALRPLPREQEDRVLQKFRLWWTYHSNAIEGNSLTQGETEVFLMEGLTAKGKPLKDHLDLRGHADAINYLLGFIRDRHELTEADLRHLHEILLVEPFRTDAITPDGQPTTKLIAVGQYKTGPNHVRTPTGEIHYYATPEETPAKMGDLMAWLREETARGVMHPVEIAARFHHRFTAIHPFDDGNGRMSRLLMNLMLMQAGYPPVVIRLGEKNEYLAALRRADAGEDQDFLAFIAGHVVESLELYLRAAAGEDIAEPTDVEKEIALEILRLKHVEEPEPRTPGTLWHLFGSSLRPLFAEAARMLGPLGGLFSQADVLVAGNYGAPGGTNHGESLPAGLGNFADRLADVEWWQNGNIVTSLRLEVNFKGFKKARYDAFDLSQTLLLNFAPLKYTVTIANAHPPLTIQHFYQEPLTKDEIAEVSQHLARLFLDAIRQKTNGHA